MSGNCDQQAKRLDGRKSPFCPVAFPPWVFFFFVFFSFSGLLMSLLQHEPVGNRPGPVCSLASGAWCFSAWILMLAGAHAMLCFALACFGLR